MYNMYHSLFFMAFFDLGLDEKITKTLSCKGSYEVQNHFS